MINGANHTGHIHVGDLDQWTFHANQGDTISVIVGEVGPDSAFVPWIRLRAPNGLSLGSDWDNLTGQVNVTAQATGTYTVVIATNDTGNDATGNYVLTLAKTPGAFIVPWGDEGGVLIGGVNDSGHIHVGDLDQWTFSAVQGTALSLSIGEVGTNSGFVPWIRLRAPNGTQLGSNWGALAARINISAPQTGVYTVVVATNDTGNDNAGNYQLSISGSVAAP